MSYARIAGTGGYLPEQTLTNADLEKIVDTTDEWIMKLVGVRKRHIIGDSADTTTTMAVEASRRAIEMAGIDPQEIEVIIVGTATPEYYFPSTACIVQKELGIKADVPAFDLNAACAGFVYGLSVADQFFRAGTVKTALVIGVDSLTKLVDWTDRSTCVLFGDGAGAVVLKEDENTGILSTHIHANGHYSDCISAANPIWGELGTPAHLQMRGGEVFKIAVTKLGEIVEQTIEKTGLKKSDIDWLVPHQANMRIVKATAQRLNLPLDRVVVTVEEHGNTSAASVPLALDHAVRKGQIRRGETLLLEAFGAGLAWGSALVKF